MSEHQETDRAVWEDIFPFEPYPNQVEGINRAIDTLRSNGINLLEGPCGTGKTLISLTAGLALVRDDSTDFERILVITSKKQQLAAFEDDLEAINNHSTSYFPGLTLIGKSELCPYVEAGKIDGNEIYHRCISLRDNTRQLMVEAVRDKRTSREANAAFGLEVRAERLPTEETLSVDGVDTMYQPEIPDVNGTEYCPFYASHITNSVADEFPLTINRVTTGEEILKEGSRCGTCPHLEMRRLYSQATVIMGNYKHAFDPTTVAALTGPVIDDSTLLICDEAHGLVQEVRDQLSYSISFRTLERAIQNIKEVENWVTGGGHRRKRRLAQKIIANTPLSGPDLATAVSFLEKIQSILATDIVDGLEEEWGDYWRQAVTNPDRDEVTIALQNPSDPEPDSISAWVERNGYEEIWELFLQSAKLVSAIKDVVSREVDGKSPDGSFAIGNVYELFERWWVGGNSEYFRRVTLRPRNRTDNDPPEGMPWRAGYTARVQINNSIPQDEIAATLDVFGGAILMSATLSPLDIYEEVTGVTKLKNGTQPAGGLVTKAKTESDQAEEEEDVEAQKRNPNVTNVGKQTASSDTPLAERRRDVSHTAFELGFPKENRASFAVDAPKFTWSNRWPPDENRSLRETYSQAITATVQTTPGNVLVCMPSYQEAAWASEMLIEDNHVQKKVLTDTSSSDGDTEQLKEAFFAGQPKVLTTSLRGTLTEGVDFDGSKLYGVVVCGVPIAQTGTPLANAIETAYDHRFDGKGFEYAFAVPAVRKARQAIGRVIRGQEEIGVRVLVDERYVKQHSYTSVREYFPEHAREEFVPIGAEDLGHELQLFWDSYR